MPIAEHESPIVLSIHRHVYKGTVAHRGMQQRVHLTVRIDFWGEVKSDSSQGVRDRRVGDAQSAGNLLHRLTVVSHANDEAVVELAANSEASSTSLGSYSPRFTALSDD